MVTVYIITKGQLAADALEIKLTEKPSKNDLIAFLGICFRVKEVIHDVNNEKIFVAAEVHSEENFSAMKNGTLIQR